VVQVETRVSSQVQLLKLGGQVLWQRDVTQLIAAQIHTLATEEEALMSHTHTQFEPLIRT